MAISWLIIWLLGQASVVSWAVDFLKRIPIVAANPRAAAAVLNMGVMLLVQAGAIPFGPELKGFLEAVVAGLLAGLTSIGVHEAEPKLAAKFGK